MPNPAPAGSALVSVAAASRTSAFAVGGVGGPKALIERWNGTTWKTAPSPGAGLSTLSSVAATSATSAWAVGYSSRNGVTKTLILHWNGTAWK